MVPPTAAPSLLRSRDFALIWWSGVALYTGSHAMFVVLPVLVFEQTSSPRATALTVLCWALPPATIGHVAGVVADQVDRRRLLIWTNLLVAGLTALYLFLGEAPWWALGLVALAISTVGAFLGPAEHALVPEVVPPERLGEGAALNALNNNLGRLVGPMAGGVLYATGGLTGFIVVKVALTLLAVALLLGVSAVRPYPPPRPERRERLGTAWVAGATAVWRHRRLRLVVILLSVTAFGEGFLGALLAPLVSVVIGGGADVLGLILSAQAVGGLLGAWWATRLADRHDPLWLLGVTSLVGALLLLVIFNYGWLYPVAWPAVVLTGLIGIPFAIFGAAQILALQRYSVAEMRGRVFSMTFGVMALVQLAGILLAGVSAEWWGPVVINVDAVAYLVAGTIALLAVGSRRIGRWGMPSSR